ncbi:MAG TPA: HNH endonuclease [Gemmataceae bacterium]|nr:HNH endonuclease [Gemmataceae bacterium]
MTTPTPEPHKLTGTRRGWWYVVAFAGQRDGVNLWHCICGVHEIERIIPEPKLLNRKTNSLDQRCRCKGWVGRLTDRVFGQWTVTGPAVPAVKPGEGKDRRLWRCRCACGRKVVVPHECLISGRLLSCGCRPHAEVFKEVDARRRRAGNRLFDAWLRSGREQADKGWTPAMERALRFFQPRCVLCGSSDDLTNHHVHPVFHGHGLRPGNAVRLCRSCNSSINIRDVGELDPETAGKLLDAAASFLAYLEGGCIASEVYAGAPTDITPKPPDPALVAILRAVEHDDAGVLSLAAWLEERGDPRAAAIRDVVGLRAELGAPMVRGEEVSYRVLLMRNGQPCGHGWEIRPAGPGSAEKPVEEYVRGLVRHQRSSEVYERLGLSMAQSRALKEYLGLSPNAPACTIEEMARREGVKEQTVRIRINQAVHNLVNPAEALRREEGKRRYREMIDERLPTAKRER